jgi:hypothetical protein
MASFGAFFAATGNDCEISKLRIIEPIIDDKVNVVQCGAVLLECY